MEDEVQLGLEEVQGTSNATLIPQGNSSGTVVSPVSDPPRFAIAPATSNLHRFLSYWSEVEHHFPMVEGNHTKIGVFRAVFWSAVPNLGEVYESGPSGNQYYTTWFQDIVEYSVKEAGSHDGYNLYTKRRVLVVSLPHSAATSSQGGNGLGKDFFTAGNWGLRVISCPLPVEMLFDNNPVM